MLIGRMYDYNSSEITVERGIFKTYVTVESKGEKFEFELDKYKLQQLINLLENCKDY